MKLLPVIINQFNWLLILCEIIVIFCLSLALTLINLSYDDYEQSTYWKILYIHVPLASLSLIIYTMKVICSIVNLVWQFPIMSIIARQIAPVALMFQILTLLTGSFWGKVSWGTYWQFDSRMTSMLIITIITFFYVLIDNLLTNSTEIKTWQRKDRLLSIISITGGFFIPIIKYSVDWWSNLHQKNSINIFQTSNNALDTSIHLPLILMFIVLSLTCFIIIINRVIRYQSERKQVILQH